MRHTWTILHANWKIVIALFGVVAFTYIFTRPMTGEVTGRKANKHSWWPVQSIDTMKLSRDVAREKLNDQEFKQVMQTQARLIAGTGATHISIGTPYDEEFYPTLQQWVNNSRQYNLNIWFRGNWSGWENWFGYVRISREQHLQKTSEFILQHPEIFQDGDIFSPCPECENGGPGDPRQTGDVTGFRQFLINLTRTCEAAFNEISKDVACNYHSMNGDVASLIMDSETTNAVGGLVVVDHYVPTVKQLTQDIRDLAEQSQGRVVLGEFGVPIPDLHGDLTDQQQAEWLQEALSELSGISELAGLNYWTATHSSTELWHSGDQPTPAVEVLTNYYSPRTITGIVRNIWNRPVSEAQIFNGYQRTRVNRNGDFTVSYLPQYNLTISAPGYYSQTLTSPSNIQDQENLTIILQKPFSSWWQRWLQRLFG